MFASTVSGTEKHAIRHEDFLIQLDVARLLVDDTFP